jgi:ABC-type uncharacterized transport system involved in gliding motility auxiliary subunit
VSYAREQTTLRQGVSQFLDKFRRVKPDIDYRFVNPDSVPDEVRQLGISINGELVIQYQGRTEHVRKADEAEVINALLRLSRNQETWIAFIEGHGERNPSGKANHDLGDWGNYLTTRGYRIRALNLAQISAIPDNTSVVVLAGPQVALLPGETRLLISYLQQGGNLLWLTDPGEAELSRELASYLGVQIANGTIVDVAGQLIGINDPSITMLTESLYAKQAALEDFRLTTLFPRAAALIASANDNWSHTPLLGTGDHTWLETGAIDNTSQFDQGSEQKGPLTLGLIAVRKGAESTSGQKVVIIGDGDFLSNRFLGNAGNLDLGLRLISWLGNDAAQIEIPARIATDTQLSLSPITIGIIGIGFLLVLPVLFALVGLALWWQRKRS